MVNIATNGLLILQLADSELFNTTQLPKDLLYSSLKKTKRTQSIFRIEKCLKRTNVKIVEFRANFKRQDRLELKEFYIKELHFFWHYCMYSVVLKSNRKLTFLVHLLYLQFDNSTRLQNELTTTSYIFHSFVTLPFRKTYCTKINKHQYYSTVFKFIQVETAR